MECVVCSLIERWCRRHRVSTGWKGQITTLRSLPHIPQATTTEPSETGGLFKKDSRRLSYIPHMPQATTTLQKLSRLVPPGCACVDKSCDKHMAADNKQKIGDTLMSSYMMMRTIRNMKLCVTCWMSSYPMMRIIRIMELCVIRPNEESTYRTFYKLPRLSSMRQGSH